MKSFFRMQSGYFALLFTAFIFGIFPVFTRMVGEQLPLFFQSWSRSLATGALLGVGSIIATKQIPHIDVADRKWFIARAALGALGFVGTFLALTNLSVNEAYMIYFSCYLIGGILAGWLFFQEAIDQTRIISLALAAIGLWIVYGAQLVTPNVYLLWSAAAGVGYSGWSLIPKKFIGKYSDLELNYIDMLLFSLVLLIFSLGYAEVWTLPPTTEVWIGTVGLAMVWIVTGMTIIFGFKRVDATLGSIVMLAEIPIALVVAYVVYAEQLTYAQLLGGAIILVSIALPEVVTLVRRRYQMAPN